MAFGPKLIYWMDYKSISNLLEKLSYENQSNSGIIELNLHGELTLIGIFDN